MRVITSIVVAALLAPGPALADDTTVGILAGLGLTAANGKTELGDKGAELEGAALAAAAVVAAGKRIVADAKLPDKIILVDATEQFDATVYFNVRSRIDLISPDLSSLRSRVCTTKEKKIKMVRSPF